MEYARSRAQEKMAGHRAALSENAARGTTTCSAAHARLGQTYSGTTPPSAREIPQHRQAAAGKTPGPQSAMGRISGAPRGGAPRFRLASGGSQIDPSQAARDQTSCDGAKTGDADSAVSVEHETPSIGRRLASMLYEG